MHFGVCASFLGYQCIKIKSEIQTNFFHVVTKTSAYEITQAETAEDEGAKSNIFRT